MIPANVHIYTLLLPRETGDPAIWLNEILGCWMRRSYSAARLVHQSENGLNVGGGGGGVWTGACIAVEGDDC